MCKMILLLLLTSIRIEAASNAAIVVRSHDELSEYLRASCPIGFHQCADCHNLITLYPTYFQAKRSKAAKISAAEQRALTQVTERDTMSVEIELMRSQEKGAHIILTQPEKLLQRTLKERAAKRILQANPPDLTQETEIMLKTQAQIVNLEKHLFQTQTKQH